MLFNFFKKKEDVNDNKIIAKVSYCIFSDSKSPIVDVELEEYNDDSIDALCDILDVLASDGALIETIEIIKSAIINDGQDDQIIKIFSRLGNHTRSKLINAYKEEKSNDLEPCIKPSDAFTK